MRRQTPEASRAGLGNDRLFRKKKPIQASHVYIVMKVRAVS
jgi:hypothetical protein